MTVNSFVRPEVTAPAPLVGRRIAPEPTAWIAAPRTTTAMRPTLRWWSTHIDEKLSHLLAHTFDMLVGTAALVTVTGSAFFTRAPHEDQTTSRRLITTRRTPKGQVA